MILINFIKLLECLLHHVGNSEHSNLASVHQHHSLLEAIARKTGGEVLTLDDLDTFASRLPSRRAPVTETHHFPLWHQTYLFLLALGCFVLEWYLRRWKGLP